MSLLRPFQSWWRRRAPRLRPWVILDDFFPHLLTGFRVAEYNAYLDACPQLRILSTLGDFAQRHAEYAALYPRHAHRVQPFSEEALDGCEFAYLNFLNNAVLFEPHLARRDLPFVLTLYPGGGLGLNESASDAKLQRVLSLPGLQGIITTQPVTGQYLRDFAPRHGLRLPTLHSIVGVVVNPLYFAADLPGHGPYFGEGKDCFDICFVAEKYMPRGENKGYPAFIEMAHVLAAESPQVRFHVVGSFTAEDIDVSSLVGRIHFHGRLETSQLSGFFADKDLVVSPNRPYTLHAGNFDGFPTGSCVEASLCGVAMMVSDVLRQNPGYADGEELLIVEPDASHLVRRVRELLREPARVGRMARAGQAWSRRGYDPRHQIGLRLQVLEAAARAVGVRLTCA